MGVSPTQLRDTVLRGQVAGQLCNDEAAPKAVERVLAPALFTAETGAVLLPDVLCTLLDPPWVWGAQMLMDAYGEGTTDQQHGSRRHIWHGTRAGSNEYQ